MPNHHIFDTHYIVHVSCCVVSSLMAGICASFEYHYTPVPRIEPNTVISQHTCGRQEGRTGSQPTGTDKPTVGHGCVLDPMTS